MSACEEEPCKSLIDDYWGKAIATMQFKMEVQLWCGIRNQLRTYVKGVFLLWLAVFAHAMACVAQYLPTGFCDWLIAASFALLVILMVLMAVLALVVERLRRLSIICRQLYIESLLAYRALIEKCPRECWPELQKIDCDCG